jgi:hypothetical protein
MATSTLNPHTHLDERAKKTGIDPNAREVLVDDGNPERSFTLKFKPYVEPKDIDSVDETRQVDAENEARYQFNLTQMPVLSILLGRMKNNWKPPKAPVYADRAYNLWKTKINEPAFKTLEAVKLLASRGQFAVKDYAIEDAAKLADDVVIKEFLEEQQRKPATTRIQIRDVCGVSKDHHQVCDCNYTWDGRSQFCMGRNPQRRIRMTWRTQQEHHFLKPLFEPFSY